MSSKEQIKEITDKLEEGIKDLFESDNYINYLKCMSRFTDYSFNNTILISMQRPDASLVAGFRKWNEFNRYVRKGEKSIKIIAPCIYKVDKENGNNETEKSNKGDEERVLKGFRVVHVFDISQTMGEELPTIAHELDGTVEGYAEFMLALKQVSPVPIEFKKIEGSANGYYHLTDKNIVIDTGMSEIMNIKTAIHEISHGILHDKDNGAEKDVDRHTKEVQAESVSYVLCQYYGLDTSDYSFGYVAGWSSGRDLKELKASLDTIRQTANTIIKGIDQQLDIIKKSRQIESDKSISADTLTQDKPTLKRHIRR